LKRPFREAVIVWEVIDPESAFKKSCQEIYKKLCTDAISISELSEKALY
jgi:hypothetical protein